MVRATSKIFGPGAGAPPSNVKSSHIGSTPVGATVVGVSTGELVGTTKGDAAGLKVVGVGIKRGADAGERYDGETSASGAYVGSPTNTGCFIGEYDGAATGLEGGMTGPSDGDVN